MGAFLCCGIHLTEVIRIGDTAVALLKAGAETDKKDVDGHLALELAPDSQVGLRYHLVS